MSDDQNIKEAVNMLTDDQLLQQLAASDRPAFTLIYRRYWEDLFVTAAKALRSKEQAADVVQEVFLSLWHRRCELDIRGSLTAYLHTSVRYKCIHHIEKNITRRDYLLQLTSLEVKEASPSVETELQIKELQGVVNNAVAKMPTKMQRVYILSRHEHLSYKEIATIMGISVETVKKHIQHALQLIREALPPQSLILIALAMGWF